jgi:Glutamate-cysteine ligase family 2(GCS2)
MATADEFRMGIEAEFALVDRDSFRPLWHSDIRFEDLNQILEDIPVGDLGTEGLKLEPPHRKLMPYVVEGYHLPDPEMNPVAIMPKGVEIRTPLANSINACVSLLAELFVRLQDALADAHYVPVPISFHPVESSFEGPQNKRRHDFWQWAMEAMVTYGPDINVHLPDRLMGAVDLRELDAKVNYYGPAIAALTLASPLSNGKLWTIRGRVGKSIRTYHRSVIAPAIEIHPDQGNRLEFKLFDMPFRIEDFRACLLLWVVLLLGRELKGRASKETRVYDLGAVARLGLDAETAAERASEVLNYASSVLTRHDFDPGPLDSFVRRLEIKRLPADDIIESYNREASIADVLRHFRFALC